MTSLPRRLLTDRTYLKEDEHIMKPPAKMRIKKSPDCFVDKKLQIDTIIKQDTVGGLYQ